MAVEAPIYATIQKSPHTMSSDSGICSGRSITPRLVEADVHASSSGPTTPTSPPRTRRPISKREQDELDDLLRSLMQEVSDFPDALPRPKSASPPGSTGPRFSRGQPLRLSMREPRHSSPLDTSPPCPPKRTTPLPSPLCSPRSYYSYTTSTPSPAPYHTRLDSRPFTYGHVATSPAFQRRRIIKDSQLNGNNAVNNATVSPEVSRCLRESRTPNRECIAPITVLTSYDGPDIYSDTASSILDAALDEGEAALSWLERQQRKLKVG